MLEGFEWKGKNERTRRTKFWNYNNSNKILLQGIIIAVSVHHWHLQFSWITAAIISLNLWINDEYYLASTNHQDVLCRCAFQFVLCHKSEIFTCKNSKIVNKFYNWNFHAHLFGAFHIYRGTHGTNYLQVRIIQQFATSSILAIVILSLSSRSGKSPLPPNAQDPKQGTKKDITFLRCMSGCKAKCQLPGEGLAKNDCIQDCQDQCCSSYEQCSFKIKSSLGNSIWQ